jgi:hypothetical protein
VPCRYEMVTTDVLPRFFSTSNHTYPNGSGVYSMIVLINSRINNATTISGLFLRSLILCRGLPSAPLWARWQGAD